jgi:hypothetical protein
MMIRRHLSRLPVVLAAVALSGGLLAGCGGGDSADSADPAAANAAEEDLEATSTGAPDAEAESDAEQTRVATTSRKPSRSATPRRTTSASGAFPRAADPEQGKPYWAAIVALSDNGEDPVFRQVEDSLEAAGYPGQGASDIDCLQGARTVLELPPDTPFSAVAVLFDTQAQAKQFEKAFQGDLAGIGKVTAFCLDG